MDKEKIINLALFHKVVKENREQGVKLDKLNVDQGALSEDLSSKFDRFINEYVHHEQFAKSIEMLRHDWQEVVAGLYEVEIKEPIQRIIKDEVDKLPKPKDGKDGKNGKDAPAVNLDAIVHEVYEKVEKFIEQKNKQIEEQKQLHRSELYAFILDKSVAS